MRHKAREMLVTQRTQLLNGLRGHLTEVGVIAPRGLRCARELAELIEACDETIPFEVCEALAPLGIAREELGPGEVQKNHPNPAQPCANSSKSCIKRVSAAPNRLCDCAGNARSAPSIGQHHVIFPTPRARRACAERQ